MSNKRICDDCIYNLTTECVFGENAVNKKVNQCTKFVTKNKNSKFNNSWTRKENKINPTKCLRCIHNKGYGSCMCTGKQGKVIKGCSVLKSNFTERM